ncbi:AmmeMemoRadiSam system protein B [Candidatus Uhrbacteria bacterium]|nr:AmmeMemoRadiSam system protein B [Candidatus Uhrbacteria bacterium]
MSVFARMWLGVLVLACFCLGIVVMISEQNPSRFENETHTFSYNLAPPSLYESAVMTAQDVVRTKARSGIVAHHLLVADKIAQTFASLGTGREKTVVILSPNHFDLGRQSIQFTDGTWETPFGDVEVDSGVLEALVQQDASLSYEPETFEREHGISAIVPFVKQFFPRARIVPIVIHDTATQEEVEVLAQAIQTVVPNAIVVSSIDMSHNLPEHMSVFHDEVTLRTIEAGECLNACTLEIDANAVLTTLFEINRLRETQEWKLQYHGSSLAMGATSDWRENTSHILGTFQAGKSVSGSFVAMQAVGDIMLDRGVRSKIESQGVGYPWENVARYLQGSQLMIANLEGTISEDLSIATDEPPFRFTFSPKSVEVMNTYVDVVSLANNHSRDRDRIGEEETQEWLDTIGTDWFGGYATSEPVYRFNQVSLIGYHQFGTKIEDLLPVIEQEKNKSQFVIVLPHWGQEYIFEPQEGQRDLARQMVQAGADLIIGSHPHVTQGIELVEGVPVMYSLGNFIFDQVEPGTDMGLSVGVLLFEGEGVLYLSPVQTSGGQPIPLSDDSAQEIFSRMSKLSSAELIPNILLGVIPFTYD